MLNYIVNYNILNNDNFLLYIFFEDVDYITNDYQNNLIITDNCNLLLDTTIKRNKEKFENNVESPNFKYIIDEHKKYIVQQNVIRLKLGDVFIFPFVFVMAFFMLRECWKNWH